MDFRKPRDPKIAAVIRGKSPATCMSYHEDGAHLFVSSSADSRLRLVDCQRGASDRPALKFERDGVRLVEATHHNLCVLLTGRGDKMQSVGDRNAISYLSFHDNKILRQFRGCGGDVNGLSMSPVDDSFLSSSADRTVRLWNLQQAGSLGMMDLPKSGNLDPTGVPHAAYDSTGLVFCVTAPLAANGGHLIHLYDARKYSAGAFAQMTLDNTSVTQAIQKKVPSFSTAVELSKAEWTGIEFNKSGKHLLATTKKGVALMVDGYDGSIANVFVAEGSEKSPMAACFTPDEKTVLGSSDNGKISCWDANTGEMIKKLEGHVGNVGCIASNPKYAQIASACTNTALWSW